MLVYLHFCYYFCKCLKWILQKLCVMNANNISLRLPSISLDMPLMDSIIELERLRYRRLMGTTHPNIFYQLKAVFHILESIGSARIEGNNTTVVDYIESTKINNQPQIPFGNQDDIRQIENGEKAMQYIEANIDTLEINKHFLRELHVITMSGLDPNREGSRNMGKFRMENVKINKSSHIPPDYNQVESLIDELLEFVNKDDSSKYNLLKIAIAHHRFVWIHPFDNGNGRVVRLLTYALLLKLNIFYKHERIVNPTAVFCSDRQMYYNYLSKADTGTDEGLIEWIQYVLSGLKIEIEKVDKLLDYNYLSNGILYPMLDDAKEHQYINNIEFTVLKLAIDKTEIQASDIKNILNINSSDASRLIRKLLDKRMIVPIYDRARKYTLSFSNGLLIRCILHQLDINGFLPENIDK